MGANGILRISRDGVCRVGMAFTDKFEESKPSNLGWPNLNAKSVWRCCWILPRRSRPSGMNSIRNLCIVCCSSLILEDAKCDNFSFHRGGPLHMHFQTGLNRIERKEKITMPHKTTRTLLHFLVAMTTTLAVVTTESPTHASANERIRTLGKDTLGETLKEFKIHYPKAVCGRLTSLEITPQNLINSRNTKDIHCCLNDRESLSEVSPFPVLNLDGCAVHALFWKDRLLTLNHILH